MQELPTEYKKIEKGISGIRDTIEKINSSVKENVKHDKFLTQNIQEIKDIMRRSQLRIIGIKGGFQLKGTENIFNKNHRRKLSQPKKVYACAVIRNLQNTKQTGPKKVPSQYNNQNTKHTE